MEFTAPKDQTESNQNKEVARPSVVLGTAGYPGSRPEKAVFAENPKVHKFARELRNSKSNRQKSLLSGRYAIAATGSRSWVRLSRNSSRGFGE